MGWPLHVNRDQDEWIYVVDGEVDLEIGKKRFMSVQFLANSSTESFRFRDSQTNRTFCLSANGEENHGCLERFVGAMAIARYAIRSRRPSSAPLSLRERVITIDDDSRMIARPPFGF
jgi:hypothetical protein